MPPKDLLDEEEEKDIDDEIKELMQGQELGEADVEAGTDAIDAPLEPAEPEDDDEGGAAPVPEREDE